MNWNMIGHEWAIHLLQGHIKNNALRQAYLITGPQGIGKKNFSVKFIQTIFCQKSGDNGDPCFECSACQRLGRLEHPDLFPISVEEGSSKIKVDQVRELIHSLSLSPYEAKNRIGLIIDIEHASTSTQNALLKTLEEPPDPVILILTASSVESVLETIISRCEEIKLNTVPIKTTRQGLEQLYQVPADQAKLLAHISGGKPELAIIYHQDPSALERRSTLLDDHLKILAGDSVDRFAYASQITSDPLLVQELLNLWFSIWHDVLIQAGKAQSPITNIDREEDLKKILKQVDLTSAKRSLGLFKRAQGLIMKNANLKLTIEDLMLQLPQLGP
jgi:DNA polymerase-3 subunit delta'